VCAPNCCNILISGKTIKEMPGSVVSGTHCIIMEKERRYFDIASNLRRSWWLRLCGIES
jgi:hypothetical protein